MTQPAKKKFQSNVQEQVSAEFLRNKLKLKSLEVQQNFKKNYPEAHKFLEEKGLELNKLREHSAKVVTTGALTGTLLLAPPTAMRNLPPITEVVRDTSDLEGAGIAKQELLLEKINKDLPQRVGPLTRTQEKSLEKTFTDVVGIPARATLEGEHLNQTYGYIGAEQHLMRYPGDTMATHPKVTEKDEGMAPGRGAWGYFARSRSELTQEVIEREKWYAVVQTLYLPDWSTRQPYLRDWYKYRKVLIVNTVNGNAVVADIADSGPAAFTGKHFGGSPEVMNHLGGPRYKKGAVVLFFVDDPDNKVPLGPVDYNRLEIPGVSFKEA